MSEEAPSERPSRVGGPYLDLIMRPFPDEVLERLALDPAAVDIDLCEGVLERFPDHLDALKVLGDAYTRAKRYVEGLKVDKRLVALLPQDPVVHYNLGCSYALLGLKDLAFEALGRAIALGYDDFDHLVEDEDLASLRDDPRFEDLFHR